MSDKRRAKTTLAHIILTPVYLVAVCIFTICSPVFLIAWAFNQLEEES